MQKETLFKQKAIKTLQALPRCYVLKTQEVARRGVPDLLICLNGTFVALELKASEKSKVAELQMFVLNRIGEAGGISLLTWPENFDLTVAYLVQQCLKDIPPEELAPLQH